LAKIDIATNYKGAKVWENYQKKLEIYSNTEYVFGKIVCYNIEFLLVEKFNEFFWRECKNFFHCSNSILDIFVTTNPNPLKVYSNKSQINTPYTP
jgi:hypothetical protein